MSEKRREVFLDVLRIIAALGVIIFHVLKSSVSNDPEVLEQTHQIAEAFAAMLEWHVPIFFMITGYIWLNKEKKCTYLNVWTNIRRFTLILFTIGFAYAAMERVFNTRSFSASVVVNSFMDVLTGNLWDHMWYLYAIILVYLFLPVVKLLFVGQSQTTIRIITIILFVCTIVVPTVDMSSRYTFVSCFSEFAPAFYVCMGGAISCIQKPTVRESMIALGVFIVSCIYIFLTQMSGGILGNGCTILVCVSAVCLFRAVSGLCNDFIGSSSLRMVSECTFGIYLFHPFFINLLIKLFHIYPLRYYIPVSICAMCMVVTVASYLTTMLLRKVKVVREYFL